MAARIKTELATIALYCLRPSSVASLDPFLLARPHLCVQYASSRPDMLNSISPKSLQASRHSLAAPKPASRVACPAAGLHAELARRRRPDGREKADSRLRLFLDSSNLTQWELYTSTGMFYGECSG